MRDGGSLTIEAANVAATDARVRIPDATGPFLRITVKDTGPGIDSEVLPRIFEPYFTTKESGSGLGLAASHSIVKRHGGWLGVKSTSPEGTTFELLIPATESTAGAPAARAEELADVQGQGRILVMDDEAHVRVLAKSMGKELGYEVDAAADGAEAVEMYGRALEEGSRYDAVILDLTVRGGMGGLVALREIRALDPRARVIVSSGYYNDPALADHESYGFDAALAKPYRPVDMGRVLARVIGAATRT
jgi:CheY-like chemotaxis protein